MLEDPGHLRRDFLFYIGFKIRPMRLFLSLLVCYLLASCGNDKLDYQKLIQGNWQCDFVDERGDTTSLNLFFSDSICHLVRSQDNRNAFSIKDNLIEIHTINPNAIDYPFEKHLFQIVRVGQSSLELVSQSGALNEKLEILPTDTLKFVKMKKKNDFQVSRISFHSSICYGTCPSFKAEMNANGLVKLESSVFSIKEGIYIGRSSSLFWKLMMDKVKYVDSKLEREL